MSDPELLQKVRNKYHTYIIFLHSCSGIYFKRLDNAGYMEIIARQTLLTLTSLLLYPVSQLHVMCIISPIVFCIRCQYMVEALI